jgi:hypothetical protein
VTHRSPVGEAGHEPKQSKVRVISSLPTGILAFDAEARAEFLAAWEEEKDEAEKNH